MREILFRGKTRYGSWVYGSMIHVGEFCCILEEDNGTDYEYPYLDKDLGIIDGQATPVIPETVGQFTGKLDRNGKKIFEGDIVRAMMDYGPAGLIGSVVNIKFTENNGWQWEYFELDTIEVIGTVFDDPILLDKALMEE